MKNLIISAVLCGFALTNLAQNKERSILIDFGNLELEKSTKVEIIDAFKVENGYILLKKEPIRGPGGFNYYIETFDNNLNSTGLNDITAQFEKEGFIIEEILKVSDSYLLFSTKNFASEKREELYAQTIDWETGELSKPTLIFKDSYDARYKKMNYSITTSEDKESVMISLYPHSSSKDERTVNFNVYNKELELLWSENNVTFSASKETQAYSVNTTLLGNNDIIYVLGQIYERKEKTIYEVTTISANNRSSTLIQPDGITFSSLALVLAKDNSVYLGGYYKKEGGAGIDGVILYTIDPETGEVINESRDEFSQDFLAQFISERAMEKAKKKEEKKGVDMGLKSLFMREVIKHEDGTISIVGEVYWITTTTTTGANGVTTTTTTEHYGDLSVSTMNEAGEFVHHQRLQKHHTHYGAYKCFGLNNHVAIVMVARKFILYNGEINELSKTERAQYDGNAFFLFELTGNTKPEHSVILDYTQDEYKGYRLFNRVGVDGTVINENGIVELLILTYFGKKKWGICRVGFED